MKTLFKLLVVSAVSFFSCKKDSGDQPEENPIVLTQIGKKITIDKTYLTDTTKAINKDYGNFSAVWRLNKFVCGTCGVVPQKTDTSEILTLRKNGQYEILRSDTVFYSGRYKIQYTNRCNFEALEKTFVFQDVLDVGKPAPYYPSTITLGNSNSNELTIAAAQCMVDMDGYRFYKRITE